MHARIDGPDIKLLRRPLSTGRTASGERRTWGQAVTNVTAPLPEPL